MKTLLVAVASMLLSGCALERKLKPSTITVEASVLSDQFPRDYPSKGEIKIQCLWHLSKE